MAYSAQSNPTSQQQPFQKPQQYQQPQQAPQQQASPYKAPDMSAYAQPSGGYNAYNVPRTAPKGAQTNDLSGNVPSNQVWGQAYNQAAQQYGVPGATSFTMPGSYSSQGYNPTTGQYGPMTGGQSFDGNMAYNAINNRPSPITASTPGMDGRPMSFQDSLAQREAFVGNLSQRLGQYSGGQLTGPVTIDQGQLLKQADDQLANGTFYNPFSQNPQVQQAMSNATQYMQGDFQNPFGPQANNPQPSWGQPSYDGGQSQAAGYQPQQPQSDPMSRSPATWTDADIAYANQTAEENARQQASLGLMDGGVRYSRDPATGKVVSISPQSGKQDAAESWGAGEAWKAQHPTPIPIAISQAASRPIDRVASSEKAGSARPIEPPSQGTPYNSQVQGLPDVPQQEAPKAPARAQESSSARPKPTEPDQRQAQLAKIDGEINQWERATYGTWQGNGPPAEWSSHIQALKRLRTKAAAGDPAALAWNPKMKAPPPHVSPNVPVNRRGSAFSSVRQNGDNRG
jgi:hypothetical protein